MKNKISIVLAQLDLAVGDISGNTKLIIDSCEKAKNQHNADLIIFPELSISGYPPEDLLLHSGFKRRINDALNSIKDEVAGISALIGFPDYSDDSIYNACAVFRDKEEIVKYRKEALPNYSVFDEKRYFTSDEQPTVFELKGKKIGINICEDIWHKSAAMKAKESGAEIIIVINGSPYEKDGQSKRENIVKQRALQIDLPIVYLNMIGGQDELVFDGASFVMSKNGEIKYRATSFEESMDLFEFDLINNECVPIKSNISSKLSVAESVYKALVRGTKDYIEKHKFSGVVMGLSGGTDSALTLSIACDAIGSDKVRAVMMPYLFTSAMSLEDAQCQA